MKSVLGWSSHQLTSISIPHKYNVYCTTRTYLRIDMDESFKFCIFFTLLHTSMPVLCWDILKKKRPGVFSGVLRCLGVSWGIKTDRSWGNKSIYAISVWQNTILLFSLWSGEDNFEILYQLINVLLKQFGIDFPQSHHLKWSLWEYFMFPQAAILLLLFR